MAVQDEHGKVSKSNGNNLRFYSDGYTLASTEITNFDSLTPLFKGMQKQYIAISELTHSFGKRTYEQNQPIACVKGCSWCCFQPVYLTTQEALLLYEYAIQTFDLQQIKAVRSKAEEKLKKTKNLSEDKKQHIVHACPFLVDNSCSVYSVRPMACRIYLSKDVNSCKKKYDNPSNKTVFPELFDFPLKVGRYMNEGFAAFLKGKGKEIREMTIEEFMVKLFKNPDYYKEWLAQDGSSEKEETSSRNR